MKRQAQSLVSVVLVTALALALDKEGVGVRAEDAPWKVAPLRAQQTQGGNLLKNGSMEEGFYWAYPNHFVANHWNRWWIHLTPLPEYDNVRPWRYYPRDGEHAQAYFIWGAPYIAGIYQVVTALTPCIPYRLTMWGRNHSLDGVLPHARIGLDPRGTQLTSGPNEGAVLSLPASTVWSREQTALYTWEELSVEVEAEGDRLTAILYASPEHPNDSRTYYFDTFWDAGRLVSVPFPDDRLPAPASWNSSGFITGVVSKTVLNTLVIEWETLEPASTQVWYNIITPTVPITPTGSHTNYLPLIMKITESISYAFATPLDPTPTTRHRVVISGLKDGERVKFVLLSRRLLDSSCVTEGYGPQITASVPPITYIYLPLVRR